MLNIINDFPDNVLGVSAQGKVTGTDYETVFIPALEVKLKSNKKINILYQLGESFSGFDMSAMLDDAKMGMKHLSSWSRIAFVSDHEMINSFAKFFGFLMTCEVRIFKNAEFEEAREWVSEV